MTDNQRGRLTGVRREVKYLLDMASGLEAKQQLETRVAPKIVNGEASSYRISLYLDTAERTFSVGELENRTVSTKIRIKEYYQLRDAEPVFGERCFVEVKTRSGQMVEKSRFALDRADVAKVLEKGPAPTQEPAVRSAHEAFEATRKGKALYPLFVAHYRRYTLQDSDSRLRITFDDMVSFHLPPDDVLSHTTGCTRRDLPPPLLMEPMWVVEIKTLGASPSWLDDILDQGRQVAYSKFGTGVGELHRRGLLF